MLNIKNMQHCFLASVVTVSFTLLNVGVTK